MEETKVASRDAGFHSANAMQDIVGALEQFAMEEVNNNDIFTKLIGAVKAPTRNNATLMTQLSDVMKIKLDMDKKLNLKDTQAQEPEDKILADKARKKVAFEKNLDSYGYFCTHGFRVSKSQSIQMCSSPAAGHQRTASRKISREAERQTNDTGG